MSAGRVAVVVATAKLAHCVTSHLCICANDDDDLDPIAAGPSGPEADDLSHLGVADLRTIGGCLCVCVGCSIAVLLTSARLLLKSKW